MVTNMNIYSTLFIFSFKFLMKGTGVYVVWGKATEQWT